LVAPRTQRQLDAYYATEPRPAYPSPAYVVVKVGEQIDVVEHRAYEQNRDPTRALFWMATDPAILARGSAGTRALNQVAAP